MDEQREEQSIEDIPGVGETTAEKLRTAGFTDIMAIACMYTGAALSSSLPGA